jgi:hypothetical protein
LDHLPSEILSQHYPIVYGLDRYLKNNAKPLAVICRPGLGAILECLSSGITPILIESNDFELNNNLQICVKNNWAVTLKDFLNVPFFHRVDYLVNFNQSSNPPVFIQSGAYVQEYLLPALGF